MRPSTPEYLFMREPREPLTDPFSRSAAHAGSAGLGLLVVSTTHDVLHTNEYAPPLLERLRALQTSGDQDDRQDPCLPTSVRIVCEEAQRTLLDRSEQNDWQPFEVSCVVGGADESMMVRAFVFPSRTSVTRTRILITLQPLSPRAQDRLSP